ncbi:MAG: carboxypeptidase regulatory-like domain-containing protein [Cyclobacteriaceae bacterium]|nr:carboxypeptidase regulatory-like domain-containing protein [Cyclobacteriaceae bacterium]
MRSLFQFAFVLALALTFTNASAQLFNTSLTITVRDETGNTVAGAEIKLFKTEQDYLKEQNVVMEGTSDAKGVLRLKKLEGVSYHVIVRKDDKDNSGGGEIIGKLEEGKFNKVTIVIQ